jgi:dolichyldiphosphatase
MEYKHFTLTHITYPASDPFSEFLALLSLTPPFVVCALVSSIIIHKDVVAAYLLMGLVSCAAFCSILKDIVEEPRPPRDDGFGDDAAIEYGMPSNHSAFGFFGATFVALFILRGDVWSWKLPSRCTNSRLNDPSRRMKSSSDTHPRDARDYMIRWTEEDWDVLVKEYNRLHTGTTVFCAMLLAIGCAYSRVYLGYHTKNQVVVGSLLGCLLGYAWYRLFELKYTRDWLEWMDLLFSELDARRVVLMKRQKDND